MWVLKDLTARGIWPLAGVVETCPGRDVEVRVAKVKTAHGSFVCLVTRVFFLRSSFNSNFSLRP